MVGLANDGALLVGQAARNQYTLYPERTVRSVKRRMGEDTRLDLGDKAYTPQEISALILRRLKQAADAICASPSARPSSPCRPTSPTPSARPPATPASRRVWTWCASSTSPPPRRWPTRRTTRRRRTSWSTTWAAAPSTSPSFACTRLEKQITIDNATARFEGREMDAARARLFSLIEGESEVVADAGSDTESDDRRETVRARALIEKADGLMETANPEDNEDIINLIESVQDALIADDIPALERAVAELSDLIYYLES